MPRNKLIKYSIIQNQRGIIAISIFKFSISCQSRFCNLKPTVGMEDALIGHSPCSVHTMRHTHTWMPKKIKTYGSNVFTLMMLMEHTEVRFVIIIQVSTHQCKRLCIVPLFIIRMIIAHQYNSTIIYRCTTAQGIYSIPQRCINRLTTAINTITLTIDIPLAGILEE